MNISAKFRQEMLFQSLNPIPDSQSSKTKSRRLAIKCEDLCRNTAISRENQDCNKENCVRFNLQLYVKILFFGHNKQMNSVLKAPVAKIIKINKCKCDATRKFARSLGYFHRHLKSEDTDRCSPFELHSSWLFFYDLM